jgi:23S rRNA (guanosine2251-2'-O)-methyltransferase
LALKREQIPLIFMNKKNLDKKVGSESHQSFVAIIQRTLYPLKELVETRPSLIFILDQIYDPHNFGAILRACECFGVEGVIFSKNKGCPLTPVVTKVSSGASELIPLVRVSNIYNSLLKLRQEGYRIVASDCCESSKSLYSFKRPEKLAFVLGSEEKGVQPLIRKKADCLLHIPMKGQIDSLNVSQAAACFLSYFCSNT